MPTLPAVMGVRRMKMSPGMVMSPLKRKNQRRRPIRSNTRTSRTSPTGRGRRHELVLVHAEEPRLARPRLTHHPAQDGTAEGDGGEHRDEHADDQDQGEAADRR